MKISITKNVIYTTLVDKNDFAIFVICHETDGMEIGKVIKKFREGKGLSQDELAFRTNTSAANISRIENGKHGAGEELLEALAKEFGYKVYQIVALAENVDTPVIPADLEPAEKALLEKFRTINSKQKQLLQSLLEEFVVTTKIS